MNIKNKKEESFWKPFGGAFSCSRKAKRMSCTSVSREEYNEDIKIFLVVLNLKTLHPPITKHNKKNQI